MNIWTLGLVGVAIFCVGLFLSWKSKKRMSPEEQATYDIAFKAAKKDALIEKAVADAQTSVQAGSGLGAALRRFGEGFTSFQEEGGKLGFPSLMDYEDDKKRRAG